MGKTSKCKPHPPKLAALLGAAEVRDHLSASPVGVAPDVAIVSFRHSARALRPQHGAGGVVDRAGADDLEADSVLGDDRLDGLNGRTPARELDLARALKKLGALLRGLSGPAPLRGDHFLSVNSADEGR